RPIPVLLTNFSLDVFKTPAEPERGLLKGLLWTNPQVPRVVAEGEQYVPELMLDSLLVPLCDRLIELPELFSHLLPRPGPVGPVKSHARRPLADAPGPLEGRERTRDVVEQGTRELLFRLQLLPVRLNLFFRLLAEVAEHVRMPSHQLLDDTRDDVVRAERPLFPP